MTSELISTLRQFRLTRNAPVTAETLRSIYRATNARGPTSAHHLRRNMDPRTHGGILGRSAHEKKKLAGST